MSQLIEYNFIHMEEISQYRSQLSRIEIISYKELDNVTFCVVLYIKIYIMSKIEIKINIKFYSLGIYNNNNNKKIKKRDT